MNPGVVDGMSAEAIKQRFPDEWQKKLSEVSGRTHSRALCQLERRIVQRILTRF